MAVYELEPNSVKSIKASSNSAPKIAVNEVAVPSPLLAEEGHDREKEINKATKLDLQTKSGWRDQIW